MSRPTYNFKELYEADENWLKWRRFRRVWMELRMARLEAKLTKIHLKATIFDLETQVKRGRRK